MNYCVSMYKISFFNYMDLLTVFFPNKYNFHMFCMAYANNCLHIS